MTTGPGDMPPPAERRPKSRKRVLFSAVITYAGGNFSFGCNIRDLSETGARVDVGNRTQFPSDFYLINIRDRVAYDAKVVWRDAKNIGVTFKKSYPLSEIVDPSLTYLKQLWMAKATR
ncbi:MAG: PilZ domain-containing protein [Alphaproteobacteria bacterium]|nr:PilZ domain-containing protein [Alphaproteobacteria bacterium]